MARIIYTPEGGSQRVWEMDPTNPPWDITYATEKATGWPWDEFAERLSKSSAIALQALIWTLRKREEPNLRLESVMPSLGEVDFVPDDEPDTTEDATDTASDDGEEKSGEA